MFAFVMFLAGSAFGIVGGCIISSDSYSKGRQDGYKIGILDGIREERENTNK